MVGTVKEYEKAADQNWQTETDHTEHEGRRAVAGKGNVAASRYRGYPMPRPTPASRRPLYRSMSSTAGSGVVQRKANGTVAPSTVSASRGTENNDKIGRATRVAQSMGTAFGEDFSSVNIHEDSSASGVGALAYTRGEDIHFAPGQLQPESQSGRELIGHELTHVVQQRRGRVTATRAKRGVAVNDEDAFEEEADRAGAAAAQGQSVTLTASSARTALNNDVAVQRQTEKSEISDGDASSGIDWHGIIGSPWLNGTRMAWEVGRLIPIGGAALGLGADIIEGTQNMSAAWRTNNGWLMAAVAGRQGVTIFNNLVGHLIYLSELTQDGLVGSVAGAWLTPITIATIEGLSAVKLATQSVQTIMDLSILAGSLVGIAMTSDSIELAAWKSTAASFAGNSFVDSIELVTAIVDAATGGAANAEGAKTVIGSAAHFAKLANYTMNQIRGVSNAWLSIWLGPAIDGCRKFVEGPQQQKSEDELSAAEAAPTILSELDLMDIVHQKTGEFIGEGGESIGAALAEFREFQAAALESHPLEDLQMALVGGLDLANDRLGTLENSHHLATNAETEIANAMANLDAAEAAINLLELPELAMPAHTEMGDNVVANALELGLDTGAAAGNAGLGAIQAKLQVAIDNVKASMVIELDPQREQIELYAQFIVEFKTLVAEEISMVRGALEKISGAIEKIKEPMDIIDALMEQTAEMFGFEDGIDFGELERDWLDVGGLLAKVRELASALL